MIDNSFVSKRGKCFSATFGTTKVKGASKKIASVQAGCNNANPCRYINHSPRPPAMPITPINIKKLKRCFMDKRSLLNKQTTLLYYMSCIHYFWQPYNLVVIYLIYI